MTCKTLILTLTLISITSTSAAYAQNAQVPGDGGSLVFSKKDNDIYKSLLFRDKNGKSFHIFNDDLEFDYDNSVDQYLSPDKKYFLVNFSEAGDGDDGQSKQYMCAFVRMSNGCITRVETGGICGGKWSGAHNWTSLDGQSAGDLDSDKPNATKLYKAYSSGTKDNNITSTPRILAYLQEGTGFDNILTCDPPSDGNKNAYNDLLKLLEHDKDSFDANKVKDAINQIRK